MGSNKIARAIEYGVKKHNYFPINLSFAVVASAVMFGEGSISNRFLGRVHNLCREAGALLISDFSPCNF